jgi:hypothetical protein
VLLFERVANRLKEWGSTDPMRPAFKRDSGKSDSGRNEAFIGPVASPGVSRPCTPLSCADGLLRQRGNPRTTIARLLGSGSGAEVRMRVARVRQRRAVVGGLGIGRSS